MKTVRITPAVERLHRGDIMSPEKRSAVMARIRGRDTGPELAVAAALRARSMEFESQARDLPGRPDFVIRSAKIAVFVDGRFWHGWGFAGWRNKLAVKWEEKIEANIRRDRRNHRRLRRMGWRVVRLWEHQVEKNLDSCIRRIIIHLDAAPSETTPASSIVPGVPDSVRVPSS
jgi:DNA mismatch endonuclease, patch repair protein